MGTRVAQVASFSFRLGFCRVAAFKGVCHSVHSAQLLGTFCFSLQFEQVLHMLLIHG